VPAVRPVGLSRHSAEHTSCQEFLNPKAARWTRPMSLPTLLLRAPVRRVAPPFPPRVFQSSSAPFVWQSFPGCTVPTYIAVRPCAELLCRVAWSRRASWCAHTLRSRQSRANAAVRVHRCPFPVLQFLVAAFIPHASLPHDSPCRPLFCLAPARIEGSGFQDGGAKTGE